MVRVTDDTAAHGRKSLEVRDEIDDWPPHFCQTPTRTGGVQRISFALKVEKGAMPQFEVREAEGVWQRAPGPEVHIAANGDLVARGRKLMKVPMGTVKSRLHLARRCLKKSLERVFNEKESKS